MAVISLCALPMAWMLRRRPADVAGTRENTSTGAASQASSPVIPEQSLRAAVGEALKDRNYLLLHAGFFTCGFHIAFLITHLPGEVALCGLPGTVASWSLAIIGLANIVASLAVGWSVGHYRSKYILFWMYGSRALLIGAYLLAPKTALTFYVFAAGLGLTWLATVPPTAGVIAKLFGTRYLSTLFGLTLLSHQIGGFFGAWLGGIAITTRGNYDWMWAADIVLAIAAAICNLPIREAKMVPQPA
jgi:predicted MFS family arabinose efflux permease